MRARPALLVAAGLLLTTLTGVTAAAGQTCPMIVDEAGDARYVSSVGASAGDSLDLVSGDVAVIGRTVVAVLRVRQLTLLDPQAPGGMMHRLSFRVGRHDFEMTARHGVGGQHFDVWVSRTVAGSSSAGVDSGSRVASVTGSFDEDLSEIRIEAPVAIFTAYEPLRRGRELTHLAAEARYGVLYKADTGQGVSPYGATTHGADYATGRGRHVVGSRGCIRG